MIDPGIYRGKAKSYGFGETRNGKDELAVLFELYTITDGQPGDFVGNLTRRFYFSGGAMDITLKDLRTLGWEGEDVTELDAIVDEDAPWVDAVVRHEEYTNNEGETKTSAKIAFINPAGGDVFVHKELDDGRKESLKNRVRARLLKSGAAKPASKAKGRSKGKGKSSPEPPVNSSSWSNNDFGSYDDDLPF